MRGLYLAALLVFPWVAIAGEPPPSLDALKANPDLHPQLTAAEIDSALHEWPSRLDAMAKDWPEGLTGLQIAHDELAPRFDGATKIVLYSLYPSPGRSIQGGPSDRPDGRRLLKLPRFHDYPIFGQIEISETDAVERWTSYLQKQSTPAKQYLCDFRPRHGFRFLTPKGEIDFLVCFHCGQMAIYGSPKSDSKLNAFWRPLFSPAVRYVVDALFQKNKIELDSR